MSSCFLARLFLQAPRHAPGHGARQPVPRIFPIFDHPASILAVGFYNGALTTEGSVLGKWYFMFSPKRVTHLLHVRRLRWNFKFQRGHENSELSTRAPAAGLAADWPVAGGRSSLDLICFVVWRSRAYGDIAKSAVPSGRIRF